MCEVSPDEGEASLSSDLAPRPHTTKYSTNGGGGIRGSLSNGAREKKFHTQRNTLDL